MHEREWPEGRAAETRPVVPVTAQMEGLKTEKLIRPLQTVDICGTTVRSECENGVGEAHRRRPVTLLDGHQNVGHHLHFEMGTVEVGIQGA